MVQHLDCVLNQIGVNMNVSEVKTRSQKPKVPNDLTTLKSLSDVNTVTRSVDRFFNDQNKAYNELRALHSNSDQDIVTISGIYNMATMVEKDLEWSSGQLTKLIDRKRELIEENRSQIEDYEFKSFVKPTEK